MFSWWILHDCSLEVVLIIFRVKNEVHLSTKGTYSTIFYTLTTKYTLGTQSALIVNHASMNTKNYRSN